MLSNTLVGTVLTAVARNVESTDMKYILIPKHVMIIRIVKAKGGVMDEKIKEVMSKCYVPVIERDGDNEYNMEKFAELIIRDVLSNVWDEVQYSTSQGIANEIDEKLKKLYGVEE